jgi:hypothetical protein
MNFGVASNAGLTAIHSAFATASLLWDQEGEAAVSGVTAIPIFGSGELPFGNGGSADQQGYEVQVAALPFKPDVGDLLTDGEMVWRAINVVPYPSADAWRVFVEEAE